ncbi:hypothetical protein GCM10011507_27120 [Edaphobacter acidisoli]|uniref:Uncharacterized protein n=1 Tax=Edaphobacter acidisoli TaxID=2040573 RepID=A0A916RZR4_9BACT|nr:hypothetical protein [Edaphobacter acidisoli]GGA74309.1 hypothetical protein GCM10011507_27120 [Edaphobacter acidisoli]
MANETNRGWGQIFSEAGTRAEEDLRRLIQHINDEIVPEVRRNGPDALRRAAAELEKLADRMDANSRTQPPTGAAKP